jgi:hypothetical protein
LSKFPQEKVTALEAEEKRVSESAPACEPPVASFSLSGPVTDGKFKVRMYSPNGRIEPPLKELSRSEFTTLLNQESKTREWSVVFTYLTGTRRHLSFHVVVGRDGKIKEVSPVRSWD